MVFEAIFEFIQNVAVTLQPLMDNTAYGWKDVNEQNM